MHTCIAIFLSLIFSWPIAAGLPVSGDDKSRAEELLAQARAALGGDARLKAVQSLSASGQTRQVVGDGNEDEQIQGEIQLDFLLPDKYMRTETTSVGGGMAEVTRIIGINGDQIFRDAHSSGGGMIMIRQPPNDPKLQAAQTRALREEFARHLFSWLLMSPAATPLEFSYAGEAEAKDGKADAIDVKGPEGFGARLFLDKQTHRPLLLSYRAPQPRQMIMRRMAGGHDDPEKLRKEAEAQAARQADQPPPLVDMELYFDDYRAEDGILLPHHITRSVNGQLSEEWELKKFKINPPLKADQFKK